MHNNRNTAVQEQGSNYEIDIELKTNSDSADLEIGSDPDLSQPRICYQGLEIIDHKCLICYNEQLEELQFNESPIEEIKIMILKHGMEDLDLHCLETYIRSYAGRGLKSLYIMESKLTIHQADHLMEILIDSFCELEKLSLCENNLQGDLSFLGKIKLFGNSLKLLDLSGNDLSTNIEDLLTIINTCNNLEILHLGSCSLSDNDLKILVPSLKTHPNLRQIYFNNNLKLTDLAFADLKELMQTNKKLKYLGLAGIEFTDQTLADLKVLAFACKLQISSNLAEQRRSEQQPLTNYLPRCLIS